MEKYESFINYVKSEMAMTLATSDGSSVTMRLVSPVYYNGGILFFTSSGSEKYRQLLNNRNCCVSLGGFFAQATAELYGSTMLPENKEMRDAYSAKFPGAFDEGIKFGGRDSDFILLIPTRLSGWAFPDGSMSGDGVPTVPFDMELTVK